MLKTYTLKWTLTMTALICLAVSTNANTVSAATKSTEHHKGEPVVVTLWWVIFNYPENCSDNSCGANDMEEAPNASDDKKVHASVVYGTGQITDEEGKVMLVSSLYPSDVDFGNSGAKAFRTERLLKPFGKGLLNPKGAHIHLVMRSHGQVIDEHVNEQLTTLSNAGCQSQGGPNECKYIYGAVHHAGQETSDVIVFGKPGQVIEGASSRVFWEDNGLKAIVRTTIDLNSEGNQ